MSMSTETIIKKAWLRASKKSESYQERFIKRVLVVNSFNPLVAFPLCLCIIFGGWMLLLMNYDMGLSIMFIGLVYWLVYSYVYLKTIEDFKRLYLTDEE